LGIDAIRIQGNLPGIGIHNDAIVILGAAAVETSAQLVRQRSPGLGLADPVKLLPALRPLLAAGIIGRLILECAHRVATEIRPDAAHTRCQSRTDDAAWRRRDRTAL